jgi:RNA 2',3'-cyclic 3'-phosphodiesterase
MNLIRVFIAIRIPHDIQAKLREVQAKLKKADVQVTWVAPESIHLTIQFLGNISEEQVPQIIAQLQESVKLVKPFQLQVGYAGAFPNLNYPRVIWVGITDDETGSLKTLQEDVSARLAQLGFEAEEGRFKPHLTVGRVRSQKNRSTLLRAIEGVTNIWLGDISVAALYLVRSELKPSGAEYTDLAEIKIPA